MLIFYINNQTVIEETLHWAAACHARCSPFFGPAKKGILMKLCFNMWGFNKKSVIVNSRLALVIILLISPVDKARIAST